MFKNSRSVLSRSSRSSARLVRCQSLPALVLGGQRGQSTAIQPERNWTAKDYLSALSIDQHLAADIISSTALRDATGEDVRARLTFLSGFGPVFTQSSIGAVIRRYFRYNKRLWPLIDTSLPLEELSSFLYLQGITPQDLGMALEAVPEVATVTTGQMGMRMLRAKALGMGQRDVLRMLYRVPVTFVWDDEYFDMAASHFIETCRAFGPARPEDGVLCMQKAFVGPWPKHYQPNARASQFNVPVLIGLAEFLELEDPFHQVELFDVWLAHAGEATIQHVTKFIGPEPELRPFALETVDDAIAMIELLRANIDRGKQLYGDDWAAKVVRIHCRPELLLWEPRAAEAYLAEYASHAALLP